jgi:predicted protein tyrosine phosphatase
MKKVTFVSRYTAENLVAINGAVIVSIHDRSEVPADLDEDWDDRLTLEFHDTDGTIGGLKLFAAEHALQVWDFVTKHRTTAQELIVHCHAGESRSGAIALAVAEVLAIPCYKNRLRVTRESHRFYNRLVYQEMLDWYNNQVVPT